MNMRRQPVTYQKFRAPAVLSDGLLPVARDGGDLERKVAEGMFRAAGFFGQQADRAAERAGTMAGQQAALDGRASIDLELPDRPSSIPIAPGQAFATNDPVATDLPVEARAFLNAIAGGESAGKYNVRYTPKGGALFNDLSRHPGIFEPGPHGPSSAAGRYQFTQTTWNRMGGGSFAPENQDRRAWDLAQQDYRARTGRTLLADLQANGVTNEMLSALTPTWQAFKGNRSRHIATYRDSLTRMIGRGEAPPPQTNPTPQVAAEVQAPGIQVNGGGFRPSGRDTVYGRAFDAAGTRTYLQDLNAKIELATERMFQRYSDDPAMLAEGMGELRDMLGQSVFPEIQAEFEVTFDRRAGRLVMQAQRELERKEAEANRLQFLDRTRELEETRSRELAGFDPNDETALDRLNALQRQLDDHYDAAVAHDLIDQGTAEDAKRASRRKTASGFYLGQARALDAAGVAQMREQMLRDYAAGELDGLDAAGWESVEGQLIRLEEAKRRDEAEAGKELTRRGMDIVTRVEQGFEYDPGDLGRLQLDAGTAENGQQIVDTTLGMVGVAETFRDRPIGEARAKVAELVRGLGRNPTDSQIAVARYAQERLAALEELVATDPAGYEISTGRMSIDPIDASTPEALTASLAKRAGQMDVIAERYDAPFTFFRPGETALLTRALTENPDGFPEFVEAMIETLGPRAGDALRELSDEAPTLAHAGGLALATGTDVVARDVAQALSAKMQGRFTQKMPSTDKFAAAAGPSFSSALGFVDGTRRAAFDTAIILFERDANMLGFDPSEIGKPDTPAAMAWQRAINRALGGELRGGRQVGGLGEVNGQPIVVPTGMEPGEPQRLLSRLTEPMLQRLPPIRSANGVPVSSAQVRRARLVTVGDGVYRVALDDPYGWDPQWLLGTDGEFWTIDMRQLRQMSQAGIAPADDALGSAMP
jgi:muramidase (phage lysozyme)